jgi:hypothetical protein
MNPILSAGLLIGVLCGLWTFLMGVTGWYKDPVMVNVFFAVILIEIGGLIWGLRRTAAEGRGYGSQVVAGTMMAIVAGVVVICSSLLFTTVAYPDYFTELESMQVELLQQQGVPEPEIARRVSESRAANTPMGQALQGFVYTLITGIVVSAIVAIWVRSRRPIARPAAG